MYEDIEEMAKDSRQAFIQPQLHPTQPQLFPAGEQFSCDRPRTNFPSICGDYCLSPQGVVWAGP